MSILEKARSNSQVSRDTLIDFVYGSQKHFSRVLEALALFKRLFPPEEASRFYEMDRVSQVKRSYQLTADLIRHKFYDNVSGADIPHETTYLLNLEFPGSVSCIMTRPIIEILSSDAQRAKWLPLFDTGRLMGAYAQTELGHGSDVQSLETEAVYDEKTKEFVIHSPSVSSYKWWPGELGQLGNVAVVYAKTILKGKKIGVFPFIVPLRDLETHKPLRGVEVGDIGPKLGYAAKENGFIKFDKVRIPLENMPSRFFEITDKGEFIQKGNAKVVYSAMMKVRIFLLSSAAFNLGKAVAIATRYSFIRKQFKNDRKEEVPVIQYQLQQFKLFPLMARAFAMEATYHSVLKMVEKCNQEIQVGDFSNLQECHILLSGAKAFFTWWCSNGLSVCMQCCGGHGYSQFSGIPNLIQSFTPNTILEGENTMLTLQVSRYLLKCAKNIMEGKPEKVNGHCVYLKNGDELENFNKDFEATMKCPQTLLKLIQKCSWTKLNELFLGIANEHGSGQSMVDIFNKKVGIRSFEAAKIHTVAFTYNFFLENASNISHEGSKAAFMSMAKLFATEAIIENSQLFVSSGLISPNQLSELKKNFEDLLEELFKDCLVLSEAFVPDDYMLFSAIANSNETPYDNLYNLANRVGVMNSVDLSSHYLATIRKASVETFPNPKL